MCCSIYGVAQCMWPACHLCTCVLRLCPYRCRVGVCTLSLAVALGSAALLLFSVVGSEVRHAFPHSTYTQWLDRALFTGPAPVGVGWGVVVTLTHCCPHPQVCGTMCFWPLMSASSCCCPLDTSSWRQRGSLGPERYRVRTATTC